MTSVCATHLGTDKDMGIGYWTLMPFAILLGAVVSAGFRTRVVTVTPVLGSESRNAYDTLVDTGAKHGAGSEKPRFAKASLRLPNAWVLLAFM